MVKKQGEQSKPTLWTFSEQQQKMRGSRKCCKFADDMEFSLAALMDVSCVFKVQFLVQGER